MRQEALDYYAARRPWVPRPLLGIAAHVDRALTALAAALAAIGAALRPRAAAAPADLGQPLRLQRPRLRRNPVAPRRKRRTLRRRPVAARR